MCVNLCVCGSDTVHTYMFVCMHVPVCAYVCACVRVHVYAYGRACACRWCVGYSKVRSSLGRTRKVPRKKGGEGREDEGRERQLQERKGAYDAPLLLPLSFFRVILEEEKYKEEMELRGRKRGEQVSNHSGHKSQKTESDESRVRACNTHTRC